MAQAATYNTSTGAPVATLPGPSRTITVEPIKAPQEEPEPARLPDKEPSPEEAPREPEKEPEKVPA
jgi:hypothetical protein